MSLHSGRFAPDPLPPEYGKEFAPYGTLPNGTSSAAMDRRAGWTLDHWLIVLPMVGATILGKLSVPPAGPIGIAFSVFVSAFVLAIQTARGKAAIRPERLAYFLGCLILFSGLPLLHGDAFSVSSMMLFTVLYLPLAFYFPDTKVTFSDACHALLTIARIVGVLGIVQFVLQPFVPHAFLFPMEYFLPDFFRVSLFANEGPLAYGYEQYRSNGVFMLEPSVYSQLMALAIIVELCTRDRLSHVAFYCVALFVSYSGTGILALGLALPVLLITHKRWDLLIVAGIIAILVASFAPYLNLEIFAQRSGELSSTGSSGYARFVGGFGMFREFSLDSTFRTLFGHGPGSMRDMISISSYPTAEMTLFKSIIELGLVGTILFVIYVLWITFGNPAPLPIKLVLISILFLGGTFTPLFHCLTLSLVAWTRHEKSLTPSS